MGIKFKVLIFLLIIPLIIIIFFSIREFTSLSIIKKRIDDSIEKLDVESSEYIQKYLETHIFREMQSATTDKAEKINSILKAIQEKVDLMAFNASTLWQQRKIESYYYQDFPGNQDAPVYKFPGNIMPEIFEIKDSSGAPDPDPSVNVEQIEIHEDCYENNIEMVKRDFELSKPMDKILMSVKKASPGIVFAYMGTRSGFFKQYPGDEELKKNPDYIPCKRPWYESAEQDKAGWTGTYFDLNNELQVTTCFKSFADLNGEKAGVVAIDVDVNLIVQQRMGNSTGISFIIDNNGEYITPADKIEDFPVIHQEEIAATAGTGLEFLDINNQTYYITSAPVKITDWKLGILIPYEKVNTEVIDILKKYITGTLDDSRKKLDKELSSTRFLAIGFIVLAGIGIFLLAWSFSKKITKPIYKLVDGVKEIGAGDLDYRMEIETGDEFQILGQAVNLMTDSLKKYIHDLNEATIVNERIQSEIDMINSVQTKILPNINSSLEKKEPDESFEWLTEYMHPVSYKAGDIVFKKDDDANELYYLGEGTIKIPEFNATYGPGSLFGEVGIFMPNHKRTASVLCETDTIVYSITSDEIFKLIKERPSFLLNLMQWSMERSIINMSKSIEDKLSIETDLKVAAKIQLDMLPMNFPPYEDKKAVSLFASMKAAREVGGDFYDFFYINDNKFCFIVGDVAGKGTPASLFMVISKTLLKTVAQQEYSPAEILFEVNNLLCEENDESMFVTVFCAILDTGTGELQFANGGHNPPLIAAGGKNFEYLQLKKGKILGIYEDFKFENQSLHLNSGDIMYVYSDGVTEAMDMEKNLFSEKRLKESLNLLKDKTITEIEAGIQQNLKEFVKDAAQSDDITMMVMKYTL